MKCMTFQSIFLGRIRKPYFKMSSPDVFNQHAKLILPGLDV